MANRKMTNYEAIKEMSVEEVAALLYIFIKPFMDTFDMTEEQKKKARESIREFLNTETTQRGGENERS